MPSDRHRLMRLCRALPLWLALAALPARALQLETAGFSLGRIDVLDSGKDAEGSLELTFGTWSPAWLPRRLPKPRPLVGLLATSDGTLYSFAGFSFEMPISRRFSFTPSVVAGAYSHGGDRHLGSSLEFRSSAEIIFDLSPRQRLGLAFRHISNAGTARHNPGTELLDLSFHFRLDGGGTAAVRP